MIDDAAVQTDNDLHECEKERNKTLFEIGNIVHESCIISKDEVSKFLIDFFICSMITSIPNNSKFQLLKTKLLKTAIPLFALLLNYSRFSGIQLRL